ncbi:MAG: DUF1592 domain-containing protein [Planctomycetaceae bacterium]|nr:DUF1592 domain-containing protein [Planctomycetaceae bacterium]
MPHVSPRPWLPTLFSLVFLPISHAADLLADEFVDHVRPYVQKYCVVCHDAENPKGELNLTRYTAAQDVTEEFRRWNHIVEFIRKGEMPPEAAEQPSIDESNAVTEAVENILLVEAIRQAGDPGVVLPRRLSNTEYDRAIRDLTGVDIRPTRNFPADPAGGEGFNNTGEVLGTSPNLVKKYLTASQRVADHLVLKPSGISFAPFPVSSYNERKKFTEQAIIDFYQSHKVDTLAYLEAAWRYRYRHDHQQSQTIKSWASKFGLSPRYLGIVWQTLSEAGSQPGFLSELNAAWQAVPAPQDDTHRPTELVALLKFVEFGRRIFFAPEPQLIKPGAGNWPISHLELRTQVATRRDKFDRSSLQSETLLKVTKVTKPNDDAVTLSAFIRIDPAFAAGENYVIIKRPLFSRATILPNNEADEKVHHKVQSLRSVLDRFNPELVKTLGFGTHPLGEQIDPEWFVIKAPAIIEIPLTPDMQRELSGKHLLVPCQLDPQHSIPGSVYLRHAMRQPPDNKLGRNTEHLIYGNSQTAKSLVDAADIFCHAFPNRFYYVDDRRGLAAGFHLVEGFFRDDQPLMQKVLSQSEQAELDRLWQELDFVTQSAETLLRGFVWFERSEREVLHDKRFDFLRPEDPQLIQPSLLDRFEKAYLDKLGVKRMKDTLEAESPDAKSARIHGFFAQIRAGLRQQNAATKTAEQLGLADIQELAGRAYRRPVAAKDRDSLRSLYEKLRRNGQTVEASLRAVLAAILMSPEFCYLYTTRSDLDTATLLEDHDLASRLSFFLWSSLPDRELLTVASKEKLQNDDELIAQTRRMLKDDRIEAFAREFFGQWLRYRDYLAKDPINREAFPEYTEELRIAIAEEPVRLAMHLIQTDRPVTDLLTTDRTFVNQTLAKHYGGQIERQYQQAAAGRDGQEWHPVNGLHQAGRGGLFGMAVVLTKNSAGDRTSPVKRGFWSVHHLLGQHFPPPPADVPDLPTSEKTSTQSIRELLAVHVADAQCARCHTHFDSLGLAMEGFDAIGRARTNDGAGRPIDNSARLPNGEIAKGVPDLIKYVEQYRRDDFVKTLCRRFLGYALGRSVILSDQPFLAEMEAVLEKNDYRFSVMFEMVVRSEQFRKQRGKGS